MREWNILPPNVPLPQNVGTFKRGIDKLDLLALVKKAHNKALLHRHSDLRVITYPGVCAVSVQIQIQKPSIMFIMG